MICYAQNKTVFISKLFSFKVFSPIFFVFPRHSISDNVPRVAEVTEAYSRRQFGRGRYSARTGYMLLYAGQDENRIMLSHGWRYLKYLLINIVSIFYFLKMKSEIFTSGWWYLIVILSVAPMPPWIASFEHQLTYAKQDSQRFCHTGLLLTISISLTGQTLAQIPQPLHFSSAKKLLSVNGRSFSKGRCDEFESLFNSFNVSLWVSDLIVIFLWFCPYYFFHLLSIGMNVLVCSICASRICICLIIPAHFSNICSMAIFGSVNLPFW